MLAALMIGRHFFASAVWKAARACGGGWCDGGISLPNSSRFYRTAGSARASAKAELSLDTMSRGVRFGARRPRHA